MVEDRLETADDSAIAEELMRDLYERDQLNLTASGRDSNSTAAVGKPAPIKLTENTDEGTEANAPVKNFLSSIGKALGPMVFGEKKPVMKSVAANTDSENKPTIARTIAAAPEPAQSDFTAVLRRAEQIKAEKKAERERAEISARAEFYATGDNFQPRTAAASPTFERPMLAPLPEPRREAPAEASFGAQVQASPRNSLAVKELDAHMKGFLIDSLKSDNGYRKQALRVLTENNVSLDEIARLSKIDIGELELMRQLGRF